MASSSENISLWKKRSEIDYVPLFISLWLSLNAWMRDRYTENKDRERLDLLKRGGNILSDRFSELIYAKDSNGGLFRGSFGELKRALENANVTYDKFKDKKISFSCCVIEWNNGQLNFESVLKGKRQRSKIKIDDDLWIEDDTKRLFAAYMEIVYQIRCVLFHGDLIPKSENERVIKQLYLTLSMIMENI